MDRWAIRWGSFMTWLSVITLFGVMAGLAAMPSSSVLLVVTRSATLNVQNGLATSAGVVAGDLVFMTLAILGLSALAEQLGGLFIIINYAAAAYLIWFGITLLRSQRKAGADMQTSNDVASGGLFASFIAGFFLTMGDVKAIFFYASLLPAFVDLANLTVLDIAIVSAVTVVAVGGVKAIYAVFAQSIARRGKGFAYAHEAKLGIGGLMVGAGVLLASRSS